MLALLLSLFFTVPAQASDFDHQAEAKYQALSDDFAGNPYFKSAAVNQYRDGVPSPFMQRLYSSERSEDFNNAAPYSADVLSRISDFHMLPYKVFRLALLGHSNILREHPQWIKNPDLLTVVNFDDPIQSRRLYVFDLKNNRVVFNAFVSHGYKSDPTFRGISQQFSNEMGSNESSLGFFITGARSGPSSHFRYMTPVRGIDGALNNQAEKRGILLHEWKALEINMLGSAAPHARLYAETEGCFGLSAYDSGRFYGLADRPLSDLIIDTVVGQSVLFAYSSVVDLESASLYLGEAK